MGFIGEVEGHRAHTYVSIYMYVHVGGFTPQFTYIDSVDPDFVEIEVIYSRVHIYVS